MAFTAVQHAMEANSASVPPQDDLSKGPILGPIDAITTDLSSTLVLDDKTDLLRVEDHAATFFVALAARDHAERTSDVTKDEPATLESPNWKTSKNTTQEDLSIETTSDHSNDVFQSDSEFQHSPVAFQGPPGLIEGSPKVDATSLSAPLLHAPPSTPLPEGVVHTEDAVEASIDILSRSFLDDVLPTDPTIFQDHRSDYSLRRLERLQTFIPDTLLPDDLLIHVLGKIRRLSDASTPSHPVRYVRVYPKSSTDVASAANAYDGRRPGAPVHTAHLYLRRANRLGEGNHSHVYRAPLSLRLDPDSEEASRVSVAVKVASGLCDAHAMLRTEAQLYNAFPRRMMEDTVVPSSPYSKPGDDAEPDSTSDAEGDEGRDVGGGESEGGRGAGTSDAPDDSTSSQNNVGVVSSESAVQPVKRNRAHLAASPSTQAEMGTTSATEQRTQAAVADASPDSSEAANETAVNAAEPSAPGVTVLPAIVPKFYGYYAPVNEDGTLRQQTHLHCDTDYSYYCSVNWPTSVLLLEECGVPLTNFRDDGGELISMQAREGCYRLFERLHAEGFVQNSPYERNILVQPGPLSAPREKRSLRAPSFRIIDFGRGLQDSNASSGHEADKELAKARAACLH
ncbi:hypothetical protein C8Q77DRAFT_1157398 [Trametes polyzona]|nr:hypothetical protein C8Q77DRAFT_1157398 [Trametes polyzona]